MSTETQHGRTAAADHSGLGADLLFDAMTGPVGHENPYPFYAGLRALAPVYVRGGDTAILTGYEGCDEVLRDAGRFPVPDPAWMDRQGRQWRQSPALAVIGASMLAQNPPTHTGLRRLVGSAFTPARVRELSDRVGALIERRLDAMAEAGSDGGVVDFQDLLALPLPMSVIGVLLGIPEQDTPWLREHAADLSEVLDLFVGGAAIGRADAAQRAITPYLADLAERRRAEPGDDLMTAMVAARDAAPGPDGQARLSDEELIATASLLFLAGYETTVNLLTNGVVELLRHPEQAALLRADPELAASCVEELLRYDAPVQGTSRYAAADCVLGGVELAAGTELVPLIGAANRDPRRFADPDRFDITRTPAKALAFGAGIHFCIGAPLARLEASLTLPAVLRRFPKLAAAGDPVRRASFNLRGYTSVPVTVR